MKYTFYMLPVLQEFPYLKLKHIILAKYSELKNGFFYVVINYMFHVKTEVFLQTGLWHFYFYFCQNQVQTFIKQKSQTLKINTLPL